MVMSTSITIVAIAICLAGCSQKPPDDTRLIQAAIQFSYGSVYNDLTDLRKDYPSFTPRVRRWSDDLTFLIGDGLYAIRMPEEEVLVTANGRAQTTRKCGSVEAECELVAPQVPELGIVGTVQLGAPDYRVAQNLEVIWEGTPGYVYVSGHCFAAFKSSTEPLVLKVKIPGDDGIKISGTYGAHLIAATFDGRGNYYGSGRISKAMFRESRTCAAQARANWPNVGGWARKR
jgi:hypothetical protein